MRYYFQKRNQIKFTYPSYCALLFLSFSLVEMMAGIRYETEIATLPVSLCEKAESQHTTSNYQSYPSRPDPMLPHF